MTFMTRSDIADAFGARGWQGRSGEYFFDGRGGTLHPHLHMRFQGQSTVREGRDIRLAITMLAWSDGRQGQGGGGQTYISGGEVTQRDWKAKVGLCNPAMAEELAWVMSYFTMG
jgi:hypothetical protein